MNHDPFAFLYDADDLKDALGDRYIGPDRLPKSTEVRIAKFNSGEDSDGFDVELYCCAMPAQFYTIKAIPSTNSVGEMREGFALSTGSGELAWAVLTAEKIADGMVGVAQ